ncbi:uncharacterized protein BO72DRAFT_699 [Aspergillus fijiensis CBS 313.89]|uniref:Uncharacterized protein n=1 Tax=Aspergillus fijiensis CBS 313.89 TaxID=1448319 RepID=A0A8G1S1V8_9EURO|nr:uncharacterized protein BO72DRAFT_699 [Aspergillus fijiensis CBS 313.89]RAK82523.1 hypothetical protein BO72DRAFT_699 [Aspergillus fijiensis CBS 313.89]
MYEYLSGGTDERPQPGLRSLAALSRRRTNCVAVKGKVKVRNATVMLMAGCLNGLMIVLWRKAEEVPPLTHKTRQDKVTSWFRLAVGLRAVIVRQLTHDVDKSSPVVELNPIVANHNNNDVDESCAICLIKATEFCGVVIHQQTLCQVPLPIDQVQCSQETDY